MPRAKKKTKEQKKLDEEPGFGRQWKNRIVGYGEEAPDQLLANPKNWRMHPDVQAKALQGVLHEVGVVQNIIVNKRTGMLVDGHLRTMLALKSEQRSVPVTYVDLSDEEEAKVLASLDPIAALAGTDNVQLDALLAEIETDSPGLQNLLDSLKTEVEQAKGVLDEDGIETQTRYSSGILMLREDPLFETKHPGNVWNIPELFRTRGELEGGTAEDDPTPLLAQESDIPEDVWGGSGFKQEGNLLYLYGMHKWDDEQAMGSMLGFYVFDDKFEVVWNDAVGYVQRYAGIFPVMIAPDFSLWRDEPLAVQVWNLYRMYWCARYWQEAGIRIVPNLRNMAAPDRTRYGDSKIMPWPEWVIPHKAPVVALQVRAARGEYSRNLFRHEFNAQIEMVQPQHVMLYGGRENRDWLEDILPSGPEYHWMTSWTAKRLSRRRSATKALPYAVENELDRDVEKQ